MLGTPRAALPQRRPRHLGTFPSRTMDHRRAGVTALVSGWAAGGAAVMSLASDPEPGCCFGTAWAVGQESWSPPCPEPGASGRSLLCGMRTLCRELGELRCGGCVRNSERRHMSHRGRSFSHSVSDCWVNPQSLEDGPVCPSLACSPFGCLAPECPALLAESTQSS